MQTAPVIDLSTLPSAQRAVVLALMATVAALTEITRRQEHLIAELNHALHGTRSEKLSEDERQLAFEDLSIALAEGFGPRRASSQRIAVAEAMAPARETGHPGMHRTATPDGFRKRTAFPGPAKDHGPTGRCPQAQQRPAPVRGGALPGP